MIGTEHSELELNNYNLPTVMEWTVVLIPADEAGLSLYLDQYKPFRLLSLQHEPSAFGSTLTREQAFDDERWRSRLLNPQAKTFIARETDRSQRVLSSITLVGPESASEEQKHRLSLTGPVLQWELNGVFTLPEARRRGIAAAVMTAVKEHAIREASSKHSGCVLTVVVYTENSAAAKSWYEKMGFEALKGGEDKGRPTSELALLLARAE